MKIVWSAAGLLLLSAVVATALHIGQPARARTILEQLVRERQEPAALSYSAISTLTKNISEISEVSEIGGSLPVARSGMNAGRHTATIETLALSAEFSLEAGECSLKTEIYAFKPGATHPDGARTDGYAHFFSGSTKGINFLLGPEDRDSARINDYAPYYFTYYLGIPVFFVPKGGAPLEIACRKNGAAVKVSGLDGDALLLAAVGHATERYMRERAGGKPARSWVFSTGISRGGFRSLMFAAMHTSVTHTFASGSHYSLQDVIDGAGEALVEPYASLSRDGSFRDFSDIFALIRGRAVLAMNWRDGYILPGHFDVIHEANRMRKASGRPPLRIQMFTPEKGRAEHVWPRVEAMQYFANALAGADYQNSL